MSKYVNLFFFGIAAGGFIYMSSYFAVCAVVKLVVLRSPTSKQSLFKIKHSDIGIQTIEDACERFSRPIAVAITFGLLGVFFLR